MCTSYGAFPPPEEHSRGVGCERQSGLRNSTYRQTTKVGKSFSSAVIVEFRDEVYASIAGLLGHLGMEVGRAHGTTELARELVRNSPDLVLLSGTQPDESAWLTSAKLRIIDAYRSVWIYSPETPSAIDEWLSMASTDDVMVYGGILHRLLNLLQRRLSQEVTLIDCVVKDSERRSVA